MDRLTKDEVLREFLIKLEDELRAKESQARQLQVAINLVLRELKEDDSTETPTSKS